MSGPRILRIEDAVKDWRWSGPGMWSCVVVEEEPQAPREFLRMARIHLPRIALAHLWPKIHHYCESYEDSPYYGKCSYSGHSRAGVLKMVVVVFPNCTDGNCCYCCCLDIHSPLPHVVALKWDDDVIIRRQDNDAALVQQHKISRKYLVQSSSQLPRRK